jgi:adenylate cyclase
VSRAVYEQVANKLSVKFADIGEQQVKNIPTPVHAFMVHMRDEDARIDKPPQKRAGILTGWSWPVMIILASAGVVGAALLVYFAAVTAGRQDAAPVGSVALATPPVVPAQPSQPQSGPRETEMLVPELVPFISDRDRSVIRTVYLSAPNHKALAISAARIGIITAQPDQEHAKTAAIDACQRATDEIGVKSQCELYAVGDVVVSKRGLPPLPPQPWIVRDPSIERPFAVTDIPLVSEASRQTIQKEYAGAAKAKALALSARGFYSYYRNQANIEEAVRRALERCGSNAGVACMIVAVDEVFVVPIPKSMKVVGFFRPSAANAIAPELRDNVARRLGSQPSGWNAVAVGGSGRAGVTLMAGTEQAAIDGAMMDCRKLDHACRVIAIGPFLVEN